MSKYYRVYADVDLDAIRANCIELMSKTEPSTKALAMDTEMWLYPRQ